MIIGGTSFLRREFRATHPDNGNAIHLKPDTPGSGSQISIAAKCARYTARRGFAASYLFIRGNWRSFAHHFVNIAVARRYARRIFANENEPRIESVGKDR